MSAAARQAEIFMHVVVGSASNPFNQWPKGMQVRSSNRWSGYLPHGPAHKIIFQKRLSGCFFLQQFFFCFEVLGGHLRYRVGIKQDHHSIKLLVIGLWSIEGSKAVYPPLLAPEKKIGELVPRVFPHTQREREKEKLKIKGRTFYCLQNEREKGRRGKRSVY